VELRKAALKEVYDSVKASYEDVSMAVADGHMFLEQLKGLITVLDMEIKTYTDKSTIH
jgi:phage-related minor tail protein